MTQNSTPSLSSSDSAELLLETLSAEKTRRLTENKMAYFKPYAKQSSLSLLPARRCASVCLWRPTNPGRPMPRQWKSPFI